jgi:hypothetical protein
LVFSEDWAEQKLFPEKERKWEENPLEDEVWIFLLLLLL